ncbi:MAG: hypothetical protein KJO54_13090 [Gammaproteobacteria bacterium]|nr:hypothetical protein [Gammaproteobacteria bacterium]NNF60640.1 hypothetical protein [Gammaproteobacteria bacterium]NNM20716.1 hypothetical protein [Gammaproteobacteria bacterium]
MRYIRCVFLLIACALLLAACQAGVRPDAVTGIYYLTSVDGAPIPGNVTHDGVDLFISSGTFIISADGTCLSVTDFAPPGGDTMRREVHAKYVVEDGRLAMTWEGAGVTHGSVDGDTFTMDNHGMIMEYRR